MIRKSFWFFSYVQTTQAILVGIATHSNNVQIEMGLYTPGDRLALLEGSGKQIVK